jgi:hypothetical protein
MRQSSLRAPIHFSVAYGTELEYKSMVRTEAAIATDSAFSLRQGKTQGSFETGGHGTG